MGAGEQTVHPTAQPRFDYADWSDLPQSEQDRRRRERIEQEWRDGFAPGAVPLSRLSLVRLGEDRYSLLWTRHNVLLDGWSFARLFTELLELHAAVRDGLPQRARPVAPPFAHYVSWLAPRAREAAEQLWTEFLSDLRPRPLFAPEPGAGLVRNAADPPLSRGRVGEVVTGQWTRRRP